MGKLNGLSGGVREKEKTLSSFATAVAVDDADVRCGGSGGDCKLNCRQMMRKERESERESSREAKTKRKKTREKEQKLHPADHTSMRLLLARQASKSLIFNQFITFSFFFCLRY